MFQQCRKHSWKIIWWIMTAISLHLTLLTTYCGAIFKKWIPNILQWLMYQWNCASCLRGKTKTFRSLSWFCVRGCVKHLAAEVGPKKGYSMWLEGGLVELQAAQGVFAASHPPYPCSWCQTIWIFSVIPFFMYRKVGNTNVVMGRVLLWESTGCCRWFLWLTQD